MPQQDEDLVQEEDLVRDEAPPVEDAGDGAGGTQPRRRRRAGPLASLRRLVGQLAGPTATSREMSEQEAAEALRATMAPAYEPAEETTLAPAYEPAAEAQPETTAYEAAAEPAAEAEPEPDGAEDGPMPAQDAAADAYVDAFYQRMRERSQHTPS